MSFLSGIRTWKRCQLACLSYCLQDIANCYLFKKLCRACEDTSQLPGYWTFQTNPASCICRKRVGVLILFLLPHWLEVFFFGKTWPTKSFLCQVGCKLFAGAQYDSLVLDSTGVSGCCIFQPSMVSLISISYTFKLIKFWDEKPKPWPWPLENDLFKHISGNMKISESPSWFPLGLTVNQRRFCWVKNPFPTVIVPDGANKDPNPPSPKTGHKLGRLAVVGNFRGMLPGGWTSQNGQNDSR